MRPSFLVLVSAALTPLAGAQPFSATLTFEGSVDGGVNWVRGELEVLAAAQTIRVRAIAAWDPADGIALMHALFDAAIFNAAAGDSVSDFVRRHPFDAPPQTLVASRFENTIKIDDSRDTGWPSPWGNWSVLCIQTTAQFNPDFDRSNPVEVFSYSLHLDGTPGVRTVGGYMREIADQRYLLFLYTNTNGGVHSVPCAIQPTPLLVRAKCRPDFDGNGQVDFFDYLDFVEAFDAEDPRTDLDANGQVDFFDYLDFVLAFDSGC